MARPLAPAGSHDTADIAEAIRSLRHARDMLRSANAPKALAKVQAALKSAEGAHRHAQRRAGTAPRPWIEWAGGVRPPVPIGTRVDVRYRNGETAFDVPAGAADDAAEDWTHGHNGGPAPSPYDIVAYRLA